MKEVYNKKGLKAELNHIPAPTSSLVFTREVGAKLFMFQPFGDAVEFTGEDVYGRFLWREYLDYNHIEQVFCHFESDEGMNLLERYQHLEEEVDVMFSLKGTTENTLEFNYSFYSDLLKKWMRGSCLIHFSTELRDNIFFRSHRGDLTPGRISIKELK